MVNPTGGLMGRGTIGRRLSFDFAGLLSSVSSQTFLLLTPKEAIVNEFPVTVSEGYIGVKNNTFGCTIS